MNRNAVTVGIMNNKQKNGVVCVSQALERKKEEQQRLQQEILRINEDSLLAKERNKEEERLADLRAMEYTYKKMVSGTPL